MRLFASIAMVALAMGLAFWAYRENYRTQAAVDEMRQIQRESAQLRDDLSVLQAEWAYLNRPERLRELVALNFDRLGLVPMQSDQFIGAAHVDYPQAPAPSPAADDALFPPAPDSLPRPPARPNR